MPLTACLTAPIAAMLPAALVPPVLLEESGAAGPGGFGMLPIFVVPLAIFWFMIIWPERKEKKRKAAMIEALQKNDRVLTTFGMYATVVAVNEGDVTLKLDEGNTRARVLKSTIASVISPQGEESAKDKG